MRLDWKIKKATLKATRAILGDSYGPSCVALCCLRADENRERLNWPGEETSLNNLRMQVREDPSDGGTISAFFFLTLFYMFIIIQQMKI